jgi:hypothetical protein
MLCKDAAKSNYNNRRYVKPSRRNKAEYKEKTHNKPITSGSILDPDFILLPKIILDLELRNQWINAANNVNFDVETKATIIIADTLNLHTEIRLSIKKRLITNR